MISTAANAAVHHFTQTLAEVIVDVSYFATRYCSTLDWPRSIALSTISSSATELFPSSFVLTLTPLADSRSSISVSVHQMAMFRRQSGYQNSGAGNRPAGGITWLQFVRYDRMPSPDNES